MSVSNDRIQRQAQLISSVHSQIASSFHPALKQVAATSAVLFKTQEACQKALNDYAAALGHLALSAKQAEPEAREMGVELRKIVEVILKFNQGQAKIIGEFGEISRKMHINAENEKENHRKMLHNYLKDQRAVHKEVDRKRKPESLLTQFYDGKEQEALWLQKKRYGFFRDKHLHLLQEYVELGKEFAGQVEELSPKPSPQTDNTEQHDATAAVPETPEADKAPSEHESEEARPVSVTLMPANNVPVPPVEANRRESIRAHEDVREVPSLKKERSTSVTERHSRPRHQQPPINPEDTITKFFEELEKEEGEELAPPQVPARSKGSNGHHVSTPPVSHAQPRPVYQPLPDIARPLPLETLYTPPTPPPPVHRQPSPPVVAQPELVKPLARPQHQEPSYYTHVSQQSPQSPPGPQHFHSRSAERPVVNGTGTNHSLPPTAPRNERPLFSTSDYGSLLVCTSSYTARMERQISLGVNERVELIRSGERGWVLVRKFSGHSGQSIGWFPAKFVRKATSAEVIEQNQGSG